MTSKNLFIKLLKEDIKRRVWSIALLSLVFFVMLPIFCALNLDDYSQSTERKWIIENIIEFMGPTHFGIFIISIMCALICGISGFYFLLSKKRVDFYHSIPIRRETIFAVNYVNGLLIYFIPYLINMLFCFVILKVNHYLDPEVISAAFHAVLINTVFYGLIYTIVIIAVIMTGNFIVSILGAAVFLLYGPTFMMVKELYFSDFFETYYSNISRSKIATFLSPIGSYVTIIERWSREGNISIKILTTVTITIVLIAIALFLYHIRPSEAAGKAMAFSASKPVIKVALVLLLTMGGGVLFRSFVNSNHDGWFLFGTIFALIIISAIIEIIYNFDIRSAFSHKKQLIICVVIVGVIASVFRFDIFHFDTYLPEESEIASMSVTVSGLDDNIDYIEFTNGEAEYRSNIEYQLKYMKLIDYKVPYQLAAMGIDTLGTTNESNQYGRMYTYYVKYKLKNGREIYRKYLLDSDTSYELMNGLYQNQEYKEAHFPINQWKVEKIGKVSVRYSSEILNDSLFGMDGLESFSLNLNIQDKKEFLTTYKEELNALTLEEVKNSLPVISLQLEMNQYDIYNYYIYPSFQKTLAKLKEYGFDISRKVEAQDIIGITVIEYYPDTEDSMKKPVASSPNTVAEEPAQVTYSDQESIAEILPTLIPRDYYYNNHSVIEGEEYMDVTVNVFNRDYNKETTYGYLFKKDEIPEFIKQDLELK